MAKTVCWFVSWCLICVRAQRPWRESQRISIKITRTSFPALLLFRRHAIVHWYHAGINKKSCLFLTAHSSALSFTMIAACQCHLKIALCHRFDATGDGRVDHLAQLALIPWGGEGLMVWIKIKIAAVLLVYGSTDGLIRWEIKTLCGIWIKIINLVPSK